MKTVQDLVDKLNENHEAERYFLENNPLSKSLWFNDSEIAAFFKDGDFNFYEPINLILSAERKLIVKFLANVKKEYWFVERKYNVVLDSGYGKVAVMKKEYGVIPVNDLISAKDKEATLRLKEYIFTESELENIKSNMSDNIKEIIDEGKVKID